MNQRTFLLMALTAIAPLGSVMGQTAPPTAAKTGKTATYETPWGAPDLQGTWTGDDTWGVPFRAAEKVRDQSHIDRGRTQRSRKKYRAERGVRGYRWHQSFARRG